MARDVDLIPGATSSLRRRIYAKIVRTRNRRACWAWSGRHSKKRGGLRPVVRAGGRGSRMLTVARVMLVLRDRVPLAQRDAELMEAGHKCNTYWCVNGSHLEWINRSGNEEAKDEFDEGFEQFSADVEALAALSGRLE